MSPSLYSVRMRASRQGKHLTGAERIVAAKAVAETTSALTVRAMSAPLGPPDEVHCSSELIDPTTVQFAKLPDVHSYQVESWQQGRQAAMQRLVKAGLTQARADQAVATLSEGAGPGGVVMRGAVIMDAVTGERLESDPARGVRVSRMDLSAECRPEVESLLAAAELDHPRVLEALLLAGKVLRAPGLVAEICWSDAPDYVAGYVAAPQLGYQRISKMKPVGDLRGGRVFLIDRAKVSLSALVDYLERQPVLFNASGTLFPPRKWESDGE